MKKIAVFVAVIILLIICGIVVYKYLGSKTAKFISPEQNKINVNTSMKISSPAFADSGSIPKQYTCDGQGTNPPLEFSDVPKQAQSLALLVEDSDAPTGTWIHWLVWNIPVSANQIAENSVPTEAVQGQTSSGQNVYGGPCPPSGIHHYIFTLYALDTALDIPSYSTAENFQTATQGHVISKAQLVGLYGR